MARAEVKAALQALAGQPFFVQYVKTLESSQEDCISLLLSPTTPREKWDEIIAEMRVYEAILRDIRKNT